VVGRDLDNIGPSLKILQVITLKSDKMIVKNTTPTFLLYLS